MPSAQIRVGQRIPSVQVAETNRYGDIQGQYSDMLFYGPRVLIVGVPGAFTPICTNKHLPPIIQRAGELRRAGFSDLFCVTSSDPFSTQAWAEQIDPSHQLQFVSDGNVDFARACGLTTIETALFLGTRSRRFTMILQECIVARLNVEASVLDVTCSAAEAILDD